MVGKEVGTASVKGVRFKLNVFSAGAVSSFRGRVWGRVLEFITLEFNQLQM